MPRRRDFPYIWATWLPRLLTGENSCEWIVWFKAHYVEWTRQPSDFDQAEWLMRHTALLNQQRQEWEDDGHRRLQVEAQNAFRLRGKSATLAGRPDLVVLDDRDATIIDVKTGQERALAPCPGHDLPVRPAPGPPAVPERPNRRRGHLPHAHGAGAEGSTAQTVHRGTRVPDPAAGGRHSAQASAQRTGV